MLSTSVFLQRDQNFEILVSLHIGDFCPSPIMVKSSVVFRVLPPVFEKEGKIQILTSQQCFLRYHKGDFE